jgi:dTDP-4-dehydrorhamnose reductase
MFGKEVDGFTENDKPNFFGSSYSVVKGYTDELMHLFEDTTLNCRIRMPISSKVDSRNFITKITSYKKICSVPNSMTVLDDILPVIVDMSARKTTGTYNMTNPGLISHNEILQMYKNIVDPDFKWTNFTAEEQAKILASGRSNNYLDTTKLQKLYPELKNIKDSVQDILLRYKNHTGCSD